MSTKVKNKFLQEDRKAASEQLSLVLQWNKRYYGSGAEVFIKRGSCGSTFRYCHLTVVERPQNVEDDATIRIAGWVSLGALETASIRDVEIRFEDGLTYFSNRRYAFENRRRFSYGADGELLEFTFGAPVEFWNEADHWVEAPCRRNHRIFSYRATASILHTVASPSASGLPTLLLSERVRGWRASNYPGSPSVDGRSGSAYTGWNLKLSRRAASFQRPKQGRPRGGGRWSRSRHNILAVRARRLIAPAAYGSTPDYFEKDKF
jgi:hypothetical protein